MTPTRESEALLERLGNLFIPGTGYIFDSLSKDRMRPRLAAIEAAVRTEQAAEVERLRALAPSWVAFAHGYAHQPDWHSESDWRDCESYPCNEARAALAATPVAPDPAATERWTLVPGEDDDCPRCGRVKLRWVPPEYEPGGWVCDDCGWDSRDSRPVAPAPAEPRP